MARDTPLNPPFSMDLRNEKRYLGRFCQECSRKIERVLSLRKILCAKLGEKWESDKMHLVRVIDAIYKIW